MVEFHFSKSKYCALWQCPKLAWLTEHRPEMVEKDPSAEMHLQAGRDVGELARGLFGDYVDVTTYKNDRLDLSAMEAATIREMETGSSVICEASYNHNGLYCAVDILKREDDGWAIYEVKSGTNPTKEVYIADVAYQLYVLEKCGIKVDKAYIVAINRDYVFDGTLDLSQLYIIKDVTSKSRKEQKTVANNLAQAAVLLASDEEPDIPISKACRNPYPCPFQKYCLSELPESARENMRPDYTDKVNLQRFIQQLWFPLCFLDFETLMPVIPRFVGSRPYDQVPFQYSLHYMESEDGELMHKEFLAEPGIDPRRALAERLCEDIPRSACVIAYNKVFECTRIRELAAQFPDLADHLLAIENHIIDLIVPFRNGWLYKKAMGDSFSIKSVLPALYPDDPTLDYHNLESIHNGNEAMLAFPAMETMTPEDREKTRQNLLKYCELDTLAMVKIWEKLKNEAEI